MKDGETEGKGGKEGREGKRKGGAGQAISMSIKES